MVKGENKMIDEECMRKIQQYYDEHIMADDFCSERFCHLNGFLDACVCFGFMTDDESADVYEKLRGRG